MIENRVGGKKFLKDEKELEMDENEDLNLLGEDLKIVEKSMGKRKGLKWEENSIGEKVRIECKRLKWIKRNEKIERWER